MLIKNFIKKIIGYQDLSAEARDKWVVSKLASLREGIKLLDVGAGEQKYRKFCNHLNYVSQDFCQFTGSTSDVGLTYKEWDTKQIDIVSDIMAIPVADSSFDAVLCTEVLEHIPKPIDAVNELHRILKKNGTLIITAPFCSMVHMAPYHYYSGFSKYWFEEFLGQDFELLEVTPNGNYFDYMAQELIRVTAMKKLGFTTNGTGIIGKIVLILNYKLLLKMSKGNKGSESAMVFGWHIIAKKR